MKKMWVFCLLFSLTACIYAEMLFDMSAGWLFHNEQYENVPDSRYMHGPDFHFNFAFYPGNFFVGFFANEAVGILAPSQDRLLSLKNSIAIGPSFILRFTPQLSTAISLGPFLGNYWEVYTDEEDKIAQNVTNITYAYALIALDLGLYGDIALMFRAGKRLFFKAGLTGKWAFFRTETVSKTVNSKITILREGRVDYYGLSLVPYLGIGLGFLFD
jgi:hypothetical protein